MKKILVICLVILLLCTCFINLSSCNRKTFGNFVFTKIHIFYSNYEECLDVKSWTDSSCGIEVETYKYGTLFVSEGHYLLCEGTCPICLNKEVKND